MSNYIIHLTPMPLKEKPYKGHPPTNIDIFGSLHNIL